MSRHAASVYFHSAFRTGSTFLWSMLRKSPKDVLYYEPLHENLSFLKFDEQVRIDASILDSLGSEEHTDVFESFRPLMNPMGGVRGFRKSFALERFFLDPSEPNDGLAAYLALLEMTARQAGRRAVMKFVRSQGRIAWMRKARGGLHYALVRSCFDQFKSYIWNARHGNAYFLATTCEIFAKNVSVWGRELAARIVEVPVYVSENTAEEQAFYQRVIAGLDVYQLYFLHAYIWKRQFRHALIEADAVFSVYAPPVALEDFSRLVEVKADLWLDFGSVRRSRTDDELVYNERFFRIEALADFCLTESGHVKPFHKQAKRFLDPHLAAEAASAEALHETGPFSAYSPMELMTACLPGGRMAPARSDSARSPLLGVLSVPPPLLTQTHRRTGDPDGLVRVDARAMYCSPGSTLGSNPDVQCDAIHWASVGTSLVAFGPHWTLPAGSYSLTLDYDASALPECEEPQAWIDVVGGYGAILVMPRTELPLKLRGAKTFAFSASEQIPYFEPRVFARNISIFVRGYTLLRESALVLSESAPASKVARVSLPDPV